MSEKLPTNLPLYLTIIVYVIWHSVRAWRSGREAADAAATYFSRFRPTPKNATPRFDPLSVASLKFLPVLQIAGQALLLKSPRTCFPIPNLPLLEALLKPLNFA
jgi:hypothetical protein